MDTAYNQKWPWEDEDTTPFVNIQKWPWEGYDSNSIGKTEEWSGKKDDRSHIVITEEWPWEDVITNPNIKTQAWPWEGEDTIHNFKPNLYSFEERVKNLCWKRCEVQNG